MEMQSALKYAKEHTRILRARKNLLYTFGATKLPYICLSDLESGVRVRVGEASADKPNILFPGRDFEFEGFEHAEIDDGGMLPVLLARSIEMPVGNYANRENGSRDEKGGISEIAEREISRLEDAADIRTGVIQAPECVWRLAVLLYVGSQIARSAEANISEHLERLRLRHS